MAMAQYGDSATGGGPATSAPPPAPTLPAGIGNAAQANQASQFMRAQPWYQDFLKSQGQNPNNVHLTKDQAYQLLQLARQKGVGISTKYSLDSSGNIVSEGMPGWEKAAIIAGIVVGGYFLAPAVIAAFGGEAAATSAATAAAAGDASAAAELTAAGATLASTATVPLATSTIAGSVASGAVPAALAGTAAAAVPVATLASTAGVPAAASDVGAGAAAPLASSSTVPTATGTVAGLGSGASTPVSAAGTSIYGPTAGASSSLTGDILRYGIPTAGNIIGGLIQANATGSAADKQQAYLQEALDYEKARDKAAIALEGSRYATYSGNVAPYIATGTSANSRMAGLLGLPASPTTTAPTVNYQPSATSTGTGQPTASVTTGSPMPRATAQLVTMQAPDGSTKQIPPEQVDHYKQMGAQVVQ